MFEDDSMSGLSRTRSSFRQIQLTSLVDVLVLLVIFFMLTSSFMKSESIELSIPKVDSKVATTKNVIKIFISNNGDLTIGNRPVDAEELHRSLTEIFQANQNQRVLVLSGAKVNVQTLVSVMDVVYQSGGKNMSVADWNQVGFVPQLKQ